MESNLSSPYPEVLPMPMPITVPETIPKEEPNEDDPFNVPAPKVNPTPKG